MMCLIDLFPTLITVEFVCYFGHVAVLDYFWSKKDQIEFKYTTYTTSYALYNGHLNVIEWFKMHALTN